MRERLDEMIFVIYGRETSLYRRELMFVRTQSIYKLIRHEMKEVNAVSIRFQG